ncbi:FtsL-like putative cell division protein [Polaribacter sp. PL03]|uniref:FtsL-like putative cell division protein n=1 Tax=Polaribacter sp. PL03 TaxID=3088353 RepID=UPI0029CBAD89|nr:FtsL-like putative cell division protein [Polaribacter sp. PL03]MDX6746465.1 FtsL-like putative cell division protein [Polaribacter sp. PL03]
MSKIKKSVYGFLRGSFLTDESAFNNWRIIIFVVGLLLIMISSSHKADKKVIKISELNKLKRELRAEYVDTGTILMRMKMESSIREKAKHRGLMPSQTPPKKIKVTYKNE